MSLIQALGILLGSFLLPFLILQIWGRLVKRYGALGGFLSALVTVAPMWLLNHGLTSPLIYQSSSVFVDMGMAAGMGILVAGLASGQSLSSYRLTLPAALLGGSLAGIVLFLLS